MSPIGRSLSERFGRWQVLASNLEEAPAAGAALEEELAEIEVLLAEARDLQDEQARLRSRSQEITRRLAEIAGRGDGVRRRMGAVLRGKLGFTSDELVRYSFRPRKLPVRRRASAQEPAATGDSSGGATAGGRGAVSSGKGLTAPPPPGA